MTATIRYHAKTTDIALFRSFFDDKDHYWIGKFDQHNAHIDPGNLPYIKLDGFWHTAEEGLVALNQIKI